MEAEGGRDHRDRSGPCGRRGRWLGALFACQFVLVIGVKSHQQLLPEIWWMSHVGLLIAAIGLLIQRDLWVTTALTGIAVLHAIWVADCLAWMVTDQSPLGATAYLHGAGVWTWLATSHHFFLAPLLATVIARCRRWPAETLPAAIALFLLLTVVSRAALLPAFNINYAFGVLTAWDHPVTNWINRCHGSIYMLGLNAFVTLFMFVPVHLAGRRLCNGAREPGVDHRPVALPMT